MSVAARAALSRVLLEKKHTSLNNGKLANQIAFTLRPCGQLVRCYSALYVAFNLRPCGQRVRYSAQKRLTCKAAQPQACSIVHLQER